MGVTRCMMGVGLAMLLASGAYAAGDPARGKEKTTQCVACHGQDGNGENPAFPRLAGQYADYIVHTLKGYKSGVRKNAIMQGFAAALSEQDMQDLGAWFQSQQGLYTLSGQR